VAVGPGPWCLLWVVAVGGEGHLGMYHVMCVFVRGCVFVCIYVCVHVWHTLAGSCRGRGRGSEGKQELYCWKGHLARGVGGWRPKKWAMRRRRAVLSKCLVEDKSRNVLRVQQDRDGKERNRERAISKPGLLTATSPFKISNQDFAQTQTSVCRLMLLWTKQGPKPLAS